METTRDDVLVNGVWHPVGRSIAVENPATTLTVGSGAAADHTHVDMAVRAARTALPGWSQTTPAERADLIEALVEALRSHRDELVDLTIAEVGAPVSVARPWHVDVSLDILSSAASHARSFEFEQRHGDVTLLRRPVGVAGLITPWNYPLYQLAAKIGSALAAGCTVVHKPSELTPLSAYLFAEATVEAGLPVGVFNLVPGTGPDVGGPLAAHEGVDLMSFTGSTVVGSTVAAAAVSHLARVSLELGGKSASIVCDDADLANAVRWTVDSCMLNSGQTCSAWTRLLVPQSRLAEAVDIAAQRADEMVVGDPTETATELGPLVSSLQLQRVTDKVEQAVQRGARVATSATTPLPNTGHFLRPVVLADVSVDDPASREEIFGPVLVVHGYRDDEHAIEIANNTEYGLAGAVWSADPARAAGIAARLDTGQVFINEAEFSVESPFGGWKHSGFGREFGLEGLLEFTELTAVHH
ncbi:aldehyde dehydrogenase family protein [Aeromicrobium sp.]|uniref:aldehyde dehydrogenase family protein n=1 Tax=Aeromicrobium sp. TaxID=1871063 RepID=UPI0028AA7209|nr:aldehyde dehydrogenase family protein [Aeromicrobium sp.]